MSSDFCLNYNSRRQQNLNTTLLLAKINGRYENPNGALNPYAKTNATTGEKFTQYELDMRRKVEILKYDKSSNVSLTKKQAWTQIVKGASQRRTYSQAYVAAVQNGTAGSVTNADLCPTISTSAGIPGTPFYLQLDPNVPLYNYLTSATYASQNVENTTTLTYEINSDIAGNDPMLFKLYVGPAIDVNYGSFTFSVPIGLSVVGSYSAYPNSLDVSGTFTTIVLTENIRVSVSYSGVDVALTTTPVVTLSSTAPIIGKTPTNQVAGSFNGTIFIGNLTVSNLGLPLSPGFVYEISIHYIPTNNYSYIDSVTSTLITGVKNSFTNSVKKTESGMVFTSNPSSVNIVVFNADSISHL